MLVLAPVTLATYLVPPPLDVLTLEPARSIFARLGIPDASFHTLRHTAASWLVMEGVDLYAVGQILGHKTPRMTQRYAHLSPNYMAGAVSKLDGIMGGVLETRMDADRLLSVDAA